MLVSKLQKYRQKIEFIWSVSSIKSIKMIFHVTLIFLVLNKLKNWERSFSSFMASGKWVNVTWNIKYLIFAFIRYQMGRSDTRYHFNELNWWSWSYNFNLGQFFHFKNYKDLDLWFESIFNVIHISIITMGVNLEK